MMERETKLKMSRILIYDICNMHLLLRHKIFFYATHKHNENEMKIKR